MENLTETQKFPTFDPKQKEELAEWMADFQSWIERKIYAEITLRVNWLLNNACGLVKKADQQSYDFELSDFTRDYQYHDLDLSGIIPADAKAVLIWGVFKSDTATCEGSFAQSGHTGTYLKSMRFEPVANIGCNIDCLIPVNIDHKIRYRFSDVNYSYINLNIVAWFV